MADMAERTPLKTIRVVQRPIAEASPEELVLVFHKLRFNEIYCACSDSHPGQILDESWKEGVVGVQLDLACPTRPSMMNGFVDVCTWTIYDEVVVLETTKFFFEPVHVLQEVSRVRS